MSQWHSYIIYVSHAIYATPTTSEAKVAPGFGFTEEMPEKLIPLFG